MKCISKRKKAAALLGVFVIGLTGCTSKEVVLENAYDVCDTSAKYGITENGASQSAEFFARDLVVTEDENLGLEKTTERVDKNTDRICCLKKRQFRRCSNRQCQCSESGE